MPALHDRGWIRSRSEFDIDLALFGRIIRNEARGDIWKFRNPSGAVQTLVQALARMRFEIEPIREFAGSDSQVGFFLRILRNGSVRKAPIGHVDVATNSDEVS